MLDGVVGVVFVGLVVFVLSPHGSSSSQYGGFIHGKLGSFGLFGMFGLPGFWGLPPGSSLPVSDLITKLIFELLSA